MSSKAFAIIGGAGSGTAASIARLFAKTYPVALMARNAKSYEGLVDEINSSGGKAFGVQADLSREDSVKAAFDKIKAEYGNSCAAAIYQASGGFTKAPFLEMKIEHFDSSYTVTL